MNMVKALEECYSLDDDQITSNDIGTYSVSRKHKVVSRSMDIWISQTHNSMIEGRWDISYSTVAFESQTGVINAFVSAMCFALSTIFPIYSNS